MNNPDVQPYFREAGSGPGVVCIHANASNSAQWRALMDTLATSHRILAPDTYGAGKSADWHSPSEIALLDEVKFIEPVLAAAGTPLTIVGHSYGAAVALLAALHDPSRIRALIIYEPTLFAVADANQPSPNGVDGIRNTVSDAVAALNAGDKDTAAMHFIDFWMGKGSWAATPPERKPNIADSVANVRRWAHALFTEPTPVEDFARLDMPILYLLGAESPASAHAVARILIPVLPRVRVVEIPGLGHMAPITHPDLVNARIVQFLSEV